MPYAILLAAGEGVRAEARDKTLTPLGGRPLLWYSLKVFHDHPLIEEVVVVVRKDQQETVKRWLREWDMPGVWLTLGGATRQESAARGFKKLGKLRPDDLVVVHNAANPFVTPDEINRVIEKAHAVGAAAVGHPATDTLKRLNARGEVVKTVNRETLWHAETPQAVRVDWYERTIKKGAKATDEIGLIEAIGHRATMLLAHPLNRKITTPADLNWARAQVEGSAVRTGIGMDSHRFDRKHRGLALGGLQFLEHPRFKANSDGDVVLHALCNALLQAMGEGSLGTLADEWCHNEGIRDSRDYLWRILEKMEQKQWSITHVGLQLEGKTPHIDPLVPHLKDSLSALLKLPQDRIGITATTGEDLTPFGKGQGLQCFATVTLRASQSIR